MKINNRSGEQAAHRFITGLGMLVLLFGLAVDVGSKVDGEGAERPSSERVRAETVTVKADQPTEATVTPVADPPKAPAAAPEAPLYFLNWFSVNGGGAIAVSSPSYRLGASVAQTAAGEVTSPSYILNMGFWQPIGGGGGGCCVGRVGDANSSGDDEPTIGDINVLIDALFIGGDWSIIPCLTEADINQSGGTDPTTTDITIGDVSYLIDYLFITGTGLGMPDCL